MRIFEAKSIPMAIRLSLPFVAPAVLATVLIACGSPEPTAPTDQAAATEDRKKDVCACTDQMNAVVDAVIEEAKAGKWEPTKVISELQARQPACATSTFGSEAGSDWMQLQAECPGFDAYSKKLNRLGELVTGQPATEQRPGPYDALGPGGTQQLMDSLSQRGRN